MPDSQDTECVRVQYHGTLGDGEEEAKGEQKKINGPSDRVLKWELVFIESSEG